MATFTLTFNATQGLVILISGFTFTALTATIYTCDDPTASTSLTGFNTLQYQTQLLSVENIPTTITSIGGNAFADCNVLSNVTFNSGSNLATIEDYAFFGCSTIASITIPATVTSIGEGVFLYCTSLSSITIPATVTSIGNAAFSGCNVLSTVTFASGSILETIGESAFDSCSSLTSITIPASVTSIGDYAFYGCTTLGSITIPASVTIIGDFAFTDIPTYPTQPTLQDAATLYTSPLNESTNSVYAYFKTNFIDGVNQINYRSLT
jgi:hypothetical protein